MKRLFLIVLFHAALGGCASNTVLNEVAAEDWSFEERAISIRSSAPIDLNVIAGRPHSIVIGIFQLNDPNTFQGLAQTKEGAIQLLSQGLVDNTVAQFSRIIMQPGETKTTVLSRAQSAQYVGLIAGYFNLNNKLDVVLYDIPVKAAKRGIVDIGLAAAGLIADEAKALPDLMSINIALGRDNTQEVNLLN